MKYRHLPANALTAELSPNYRADRAGNINASRDTFFARSVVITLGKLRPNTPHKCYRVLRRMRQVFLGNQSLVLLCNSCGRLGAAEQKSGHSDAMGGHRSDGIRS